MDTSLPKLDDISSDDEIFFGKVGEKEEKITHKLSRRKTDVFSVSFRAHNNTPTEHEDPMEETVDLDISEDSLNKNEVPSSSVLREAEILPMSLSKDNEVVQSTDNVKDLSLQLEKSLSFNENEMNKSPDCSITMKEMEFNSPLVLYNQSPISIIEESSPEADFFDMDLDSIKPTRLSFENEMDKPQPNIIDALDLSRNSFTEKTTAKYLDAQTSIGGINLLTEEEGMKENTTPDPKKKRLSAENIPISKPPTLKRPPGLFWSPRPNSNAKRSQIPSLSNKGGSSLKVEKKRQFPTPSGLKKWDVTSPVGEYIRNQPLPSLFKTVKPLKEIPILKTPNSGRKFHVPISKTPIATTEKSPTVFSLPPAEYQLKVLNKSGGNTLKHVGASSSSSSSSIPQVIRHKGPSKALHFTSHLASDQSLMPDSPKVKPRESDVNGNKSVMEFVQVHRTDTILKGTLPNDKINFT